VSSKGLHTSSQVGEIWCRERCAGSLTARAINMDEFNEVRAQTSQRNMYQYHAPSQGRSRFKKYLFSQSGDDSDVSFPATVFPSSPA